MKMSKGINLHFRSGKYSNAAKSYYATQMSAENRAYTIRNNRASRVPSKNVMRSVRRSEEFVPFSSWEFYSFIQIHGARWLGHGYGETDSRLFKLLRYLNVATVIHKWCVLEH